MKISLPCTLHSSLDGNDEDADRKYILHKKMFLFSPIAVGKGYACL